MIKKSHTILLSEVPKGFWVTIALFFIINSIAIYSKIYILWPLALVFPLLYYSLFEFEKLYFFAVFFTPLSISLQWLFPQLMVDLSLPSEIFMMVLLLILLVKILQGGFFGAEIFRHPISIAVLAYLFWMFISSISSSMPIVSFKHLLSQCWFVLPLYFLPILIFRNTKRIKWFFGLYIIPFTFVIIYTINNHLVKGLFARKAALFVMQPFYNDHTSYGAILAMFIPVLFGMLFSRKIKFLTKTIISALLVLFCIALILSYTRAAWISVLCAGILAILIRSKIKIRYVAILISLVIAYLFVNRTEIIDELSKNKQDSSVKLSDHIKSMSNIATDASNLERINRWNSALAMFEERPILGWGPGTYMFQYAPFQKARDKTIISTDFGENGNAHSEYIGPLAEQGIPGFMTFSAIIITFMFTSFKLYYRLTDKESKLLVIISILSIFTYVIHGLLNNYLDTDKAAVPFWGFLAIICSLDLYGQNKNPQLGGAEER